MRVGTREIDVSASGFDELLYGGVCPMIVVHYYTLGFQCRTDAVVEDDGHVVVEQLLVMLVMVCFFG